jgi:hypothetical protein
MRIFWLNHGLHIDPETQTEANMLVALVKSTHFVTKEQAMVAQDLARTQRLALEPDAEISIADPEFVPSSIPS